MKKPPYNGLTLLKQILLISGILVLIFVSISFLFLKLKEGDTQLDEIIIDEEVKIPSLNLEKEEESDLQSIVVYNHKKGEKTEKNLEKYLVGVVAAEMPPNFQTEALKAQAVMARSYAISRVSEFGGSGCDFKKNAEVCTDPDHCQDWIKKNEAIKSWGEDGEKLWEKVKESVQNTKGQVITYNGKPVTEAPYHSTCGGQTEPAKKVWQNEISYITSVECNSCGHSSKFYDEKKFNKDQLVASMSFLFKDVYRVIANNAKPVQIINRSSSGRVIDAKIGNRRVSGRDIRQALDLKSTNFEIERNEDKEWVFKTKGFGHGVGLCQYGADGKAKQGYDHEKILNHYFQNIGIKKIY